MFVRGPPCERSGGDAGVRPSFGPPFPWKNILPQLWLDLCYDPTTISETLTSSWCGIARFARNTLDDGESVAFPCLSEARCETVLLESPAVTVVFFAGGRQDFRNPWASALRTGYGIVCGAQQPARDFYGTGQPGNFFAVLRRQRPFANNSFDWRRPCKEATIRRRQNKRPTGQSSRRGESMCRRGAPGIEARPWQ